NSVATLQARVAAPSGDRPGSAPHHLDLSGRVPVEPGRGDPCGGSAWSTPPISMAASPRGPRPGCRGRELGAGNPFACPSAPRQVACRYNRCDPVMVSCRGGYCTGSRAPNIQYGRTANPGRQALFAKDRRTSLVKRCAAKLPCVTGMQWLLRLPTLRG